ncbi:MAG: hypothetical protein AAFX95_22480 [Cyanobacteria bacterium J06639_16]
MLIRHLNRYQQKFLFLLTITIIYVALVAWLDLLQGPYWWDEETFWQTSLTFSDRLLPNIDDLRDYNELSTPLPFIIFGALEYLFHQGIFAGRLLNLILSLSIIFIIGWPSKDKGGRAILCLVGLLMCPYYLWLSGRLYTEMIACFWVVMGLMGYVRNRYLLSCIAFILAIASRQYMLAFPAAIVTYEFIVAMTEVIQQRQISLAKQWKWLAPLIATLSIFGWFYMFQGLAPETGIAGRKTPEVQQTLWALTPGGAINFLSFIGLYIVIPELILFYRQGMLQTLKRQWRKTALITAGLSVYFLLFPPLSVAAGNVDKIVDLLPHDFLQIAFLYSLSWLACVRFCQPNLISFIVLFNSLIMFKAFPWDRYVLPLAVAFWYLKSTGLVDQFNIFQKQDMAT